jgi:murein peptide amidase A
MNAPRMNAAALPEIVMEEGRRSLRRLCGPLEQAPGVLSAPLGPLGAHGGSYILPHYTVGGAGGGDAIRLGIFAAIHGDEPAGALAAALFLLQLAREPEAVADFQVHVYPVCNPTGWEDNTRVSRRGRDLNREFWKASAEPEVALLEEGLRARKFHGLVQLHADDTSDGIYGYVRGHTLTENLLRPALCAAAAVLPRNANATIDGFAARDGIIHKHYEGVLAAPAEMNPAPFEIIFETPQLAPLDLQVQALLLALRTIMTEYRQLMSFAQNI